MRIAICDDDKVFLRELGQLLGDTHRVEPYSQIDELFGDLQAGEAYDLVMMDLDWGQGHTGLSYAETLYRIAPHLPVIYVTGYNDRFAQHILLKETNLAGYLTKPIDPVLLQRYLGKVLGSRDEGKQLTFYQQGLPVSLDVQRIVYLESRNHTTIVHTDTADYPVYEKLGSLLARLPDTFHQCHKSYGVNLRWVQRLEPEGILLKNGVKAPVSRSFRGKTREQVFHFLGLQV